MSIIDQAPMQPPAPATAPRNSLRAFWSRSTSLRPLLAACLALVALFSLAEPNFLTSGNAENIATQASILLIAGTGMTFVILTSGIDLSVGALLFLGGAILTSGPFAALPPLVAILLVPVVCALLGLFNGIGVAVIRIPAMIVTLASLQIFRGLGGRITEQHSVIVDSALRAAGRGDVLGIPLPFFIAVLVVLLGWLTLTRTVFGRWVQAIGSNESAALNAGLPVRRVLAGVYVLAAGLAGVASVVQIARLGAVQPTIGNGFELTVITAVVLGGTRLTGGQGSVIGTAVGAVLLAIIENGLVLIGASGYVFDIVRGGVLLAALLAADIPQRVQRAWVRRRKPPTPNPPRAK